MKLPFNRHGKESVLSVKKLQEEQYDRIIAQPKQFTGYPVIVVLMAVLQVLTVVFGSRGFIFFGFDVTAGWLILMPLNFYLFQIVAECYGWQYARQIIWLNFIANLAMVLIFFFFKFIPFSGDTHQATQEAYFNIFNKRWIAALTMLFSMFLADYITSALMCWSKFHWQGRWLVTRIVLLHCIAEIIINMSGFIVDPINGYSLAECWKFALDSFCARSIIMVALLPLASLVIWWIQNRLEGVIVFDLNVRFAPFKFRINPEESVQFSTLEWHLLPKEVKANFDIPKFAMEHFSRQTTVKIKIY